VGRFPWNSAPIDGPSAPAIRCYSRVVPASPYVDLERDAIDPSAVSILPADVWRRLRAVGISRAGDVLMVAMADPDDERAVRELELRTGLRLFVARAAEQTVLAAIDRSHEDA
jgi:type IV pilus assembly protein PilB